MCSGRTTAKREREKEGKGERKRERFTITAGHTFDSKTGYKIIMKKYFSA